MSPMINIYFLLLNKGKSLRIKLHIFINYFLDKKIFPKDLLIGTIGIKLKKLHQIILKRLNL